MRDVVIVEAVRTPVGKGKPGGAYADVHPVDLHAHAIRAVERLPGLDPAEIDDVIGGVVGQVGEQSGNTTRYAALAAGLPESVPGVTVDRQCGSSQQALSFAAQGVQRVEGRRLVVHPLLAHGAGGAGNPRRRGARGVHGHGHGRGVDQPESAPADVAGQALDAVGSGREEVLADELSRRVRSGLAG
jgi:hypothetical protein